MPETKEERLVRGLRELRKFIHSQCPRMPKDPDPIYRYASNERISADAVDQILYDILRDAGETP